MGVGVKSHVGTMQAKADSHGARAWNGKAAPTFKVSPRRARSKKMVTEMWGEETYTFYPLGKYIVADPEICRGRPTFKYTRIDVELVLEGLAHGMTVAQIAHMYRMTKVTEEGIREAVHLAAKLLNQAFPRAASRLVCGSRPSRVCTLITACRDCVKRRVCPKTSKVSIH